MEGGREGLGLELGELGVVVVYEGSELLEIEGSL